MAIDYEDYEILTLSMREFYVPAAEWFKYVIRFETCALYTCGCNETLMERYKDKYMVPYPYKTKIVDEYLNQMKREGRYDSFNDDDVARCKQMLDQRIDRYLMNSVHEDVIAYIDHNYDYGVVIHSISGKYYPFQYSATSGFSFTVGAITGMAGEMKDVYLKKHRCRRPEMINQFDKIISDNRGRFFLMYTPEYKDKSGDEFFDPGHYGDATACSPLSLPQVKETIDYMNVMYAEHAKCLVIT